MRFVTVQFANLYTIHGSFASKVFYFSRNGLDRSDIATLTVILFLSCA